VFCRQLSSWPGTRTAERALDEAGVPLKARRAEAGAVALGRERPPARAREDPHRCEIGLRPDIEGEV
jgi:hypothetical protein